jgi:hypothetical protein
VSVIDCTATGAPPPTGTFPTRIWTRLPIRASVGAARLREPRDVVREPDEEKQDDEHESDR